MKPGRQGLILEIIAQQDIETQYQLLEALAARGIKSTQATLSRDIKELRLVKELGQDGNYRYAAARPDNEDYDQRMAKIFREGVLSYDTAQNLVVIKTLPGLAPVACSVIDNMNVSGLVGTLAGDDTAFLAMRDNEAATALYHEIEKLF